VVETVEVDEEYRREEFELHTADGQPIVVRPQGGHPSPFAGSSADPRRQSS